MSLFSSDLKTVARTSTVSYCYGSAVDDVIPISIVYKVISDTSKRKVMSKHKADFFSLRFLYIKVTCTSFHATGMTVKVSLLQVISHSFCQGQSPFI